MRTPLFTCITLALFVTLGFVNALCADTVTFGSGLNQFSIDFVEIGDPGNVADTNGAPNPAGAVSYTYSMGKHEVSRDMITKANAAGGIGITLDDMSFVTGGPRADMAATGISWFEAAKFVNYLNASQGFSNAYKFDGAGNFQLWQSGDAGYDASNPFRNTLANYVLPNSDEWYKAAYYDGNGGYFIYTTGSDTPPARVTSGTAPGTAVYSHPDEQGPADIMLAGGLSAMGTMGQGGNVWEWEESEFDLVNDSVSAARGLRGGNWRFSTFGMRSSQRSPNGSFGEGFDVGFRVASLGLTAVPEPNSLAALGCLATVSLFYRRRQ